MAKAKRKKIDLVQVRNYRANEMSYAEIGRRMNFSPSAIWRALNQPGRLEVEVPAGKHRSTYLPDEHWEMLRKWSLALGESRAFVIARLIEREAERRGITISTTNAEEAA